MPGKNSMKTVSGVPIQTLNPKTIQTLCQLQSTLGWAVPAWAILQTAKFQVPAMLFLSLMMTINARAKDKREAVVAGSKKAWSNPDLGSGPMRTGLGTHHWKPETAELEGSLAVRSLLKEITSRTLMFTKEFPYHLNTFFCSLKTCIFFNLLCTHLHPYLYTWYFISKWKEFFSLCQSGELPFTLQDSHEVFSNRIIWGT